MSVIRGNSRHYGMIEDDGGHLVCEICKNKDAYSKKVFREKVDGKQITCLLCECGHYIVVSTVLQKSPGLFEAGFKEMFSRG